METNLIIRNEHKTQIAAFDKATRLAIDEAITAYNALIEKSGKDAAAMARRQAVAVSMMAEDKEALSKAGFDTFKSAAFALVHLAPESATQYRKAGDFIRSENAPIICQWYSPSAIYEFTAKKVPLETINAAVESGVLKEDMPFSAIREWCIQNSTKALEDGKASVLPMFDAFIAVNGESHSHITGTFDDITRAMNDCIETGIVIENDRYGKYNPHAVMDDGKTKTTGKGLVLVYGSKCVTCVYYAVKRSKKKPANYNAETLSKLSKEERQALLEALMSVEE